MDTRVHSGDDLMSTGSYTYVDNARDDVGGANRSHMVIHTRVIYGRLSVLPTYAFTPVLVDRQDSQGPRKKV